MKQIIALNSIDEQFFFFNTIHMWMLTQINLYAN